MHSSMAHLKHEVWDHPVENTALVVKGLLAHRSKALLACERYLIVR